MSQERIFLAVGISLDRVRVAFWSPDSESLGEQFSLRGGKFLAEGGQEAYSGEEDFLAAIEVSYKNAWSLLPDNLRNLTDRSSVVFSVPQDWVDDNGQIDQGKSELLKKVLARLQARVLGFVPEGELILSYFKNQGDSLASLVALDIGEEKISVFPIVRGKILGVQTVERSNSVALDLEEGLARFNFSQSFPPRILLLGPDSLEEVKSDLLSYPWVEPEKPFFMHLPKVEIFPYQLILLTLIDRAKEFLPEESAEMAGSIKEATPPISQSDSRFPPEEEPKQTLGFIKNQDVASLDKLADDQSNQETAVESREELADQKKLIWFKFSGLTGFFSRFKKSGPRPYSRPDAGNLERKRQKHLPRIVIVLALLALFFLSGLFIAWWYLPKATVVLSVAPKHSEGNVSLLVSPEAEGVNIEEKIIAGHQVVITVEKSNSIDTTGEDTVGDKASGQVTIYNRTEIEKNFAAGTVLVSADGFRFQTKEEVTIEPAKIDIDEDYNQTVTPSKKTVGVVAEQIGADYNLASGQEFEIASFVKSNFVAKNETSFSGGSSREVRVVAQEDIDDLEDIVLAAIKEEGEKEIASQSSVNEKLIAESLAVESTEKNFNHQLGEEADQLSLTVKAKLSGLAYWQDDLNRLIEELLKEQIPNGFVLGENKEADFGFIKASGNDVLFNLTFGADLYPDISQDEVKSKIAGRRISAIKDYLDLLPSVNDFEITIFPPLPDFLLTLPHRADNITIKMKVGE